LPLVLCPFLGASWERAPVPAGRPVTEGWNEAERVQLQAKLSARLAFLDFVFTRVNGDGSQQHYQMSGEPVYNESRGYVGFRGIAREVALKK